MTLFGNENSFSHNVLPEGGTVNYFGKFVADAEADFWYENLLTTIDWKNDEAMMFGKKIITKRKVAWYGDQPFAYTYSKATKYALSWTEELSKIKQLVEKLTAASYNSCLMNLYHDGAEGMAWHSDAEKTLLENGAIASCSFGAERKFSFKNKKNGQIVSLNLEHGSLLLMKDETQKNWLHRLPKTTTVSSPRINLTFRTIVNQF